MKKIVIIGGVAGGATLAARLRRVSEEVEIVMFEKDEYIAFANCGLPYYIGGVIEDRERLLVQTVEGLSKRYNLDIRNFSEVIKIRDNEKKVIVLDKRTGKEYEESYDELVLSPGAAPIVPPFEGLKEANNVFTLRNIPDTDKIKKYVEENKPKNAVVIGGGFIGVEMAENLSHTGVNVTLIDLAKHVLKPFDLEMASIIELNLKNNGVSVLTEKQVKNITQNYVELSDGTMIDTNLTLLAIGVKPSSKLAKEIDIACAKNDAIIVDDKFRTSKENIYALGDVIEITNPILNNKMHIPLAWPANRQARVLADILMGKDVKSTGTIGASVLKVNELTGASVGYTEEFLQQTDIKYQSIIVNRGSRASYYPGGSNMDLKLIFDLEGKILGAQAIGTDGVEKRIDVISTAIQSGLTIFDLEDIELCYAPPFNSAKDPVNIAGYTAVNVLSGFSKIFNYNDVEAIGENKDNIIIDVRIKEEYDINHLPGAINIDVDDIRENLQSLDKNKNIYVYCKVGFRGYVAQKILNNNGFKNVYNLNGGYNIYETYKRNINKKVVAKNMEKNDSNKIQEIKSNINILDARGLQCPGPIMQTAKKMDEMKAGEQLLIKVTDSGFCEDIDAWCEKRGNKLVSISKGQNANEYEAVVEKENSETVNKNIKLAEDKGTIVMFSGDLDKALASMIIAQGAQAMGKQMTIFFTFWGLNMLRKDGKIDVKKTNFEKMFGAMMPKGANKLKLSQMNMSGMGTAMIGKRMKDKNVPKLQDQMLSAQKAGVKFIACTMSMDLMGIKEEELIQGVEFGGVAKYIGESSGADLTLFI